VCAWSEDDHGHGDGDGGRGSVGLMGVGGVVVRVCLVVQSTGRPVSLQPGVKRRPLRTLVVLGSGTRSPAALNF
jgi:hypothetical protein